MNILVCVKQVPNTRHMTIDPETNRLVRHGISTILNPADRYSLEKALRLQDQYGGEVTVITMGAAPAREVLLSAYMVGVDRCIHLVDPAFGGSDTYATAAILSAAIRYEEKRKGEPFDIIFCGKSTIDGETGQVGPEIAEILGIPFYSEISKIDYDSVSFRIEYHSDHLSLSVSAKPPVLVTFPFGGDVCLRPSFPERLKEADTIEFPRLTFDDLSEWLDRDEIGLSGSATRVVRSFVPSASRESTIIDTGTPQEKAKKLYDYLTGAGLLGAAAEEKPARTRAVEAFPKGEGRIFVYMEQNRQGKCTNVSLELLTPAIEIGHASGLRVCAVVMGEETAEAVEELKEYAVDEIITCKDPVLANRQLHDYTDNLGRMIEEYRPEGFLLAGTEWSKNVAARIAARFHTGLTADCSKIRFDSELGGIIWSRPAYGGKLMADIICRTKRPQMGTVREGVFIKPDKCPGNPQIHDFKAALSKISENVTILQSSVIPSFSKGDGSDTSIVVGMGRGIRNMDGFDLCCDLADALGADIGATKAATDMRLVSSKYLIGSNGKTVRPSIYFACGISGNFQHMTAVLDSGCIVAVNTDPNAEIFQYANYGVVGDLFEFIPAFIDLL